MYTSLIVIALLVLFLTGVGLLIFVQQSRSRRLKSRFGPEYDAEVRRLGDRSRAEKELEGRAKRVQQMQIRSLSFEDRERYAAWWRQTQADFVDNPAGSISEADDLVADVMRARGYPIEDFELRATDLSVDHPYVVKNYRAAHEIAVRNSRGAVSTEDLRHAMICYRDLFEDLLERPVVRQEVHR